MLSRSGHRPRFATGRQQRPRGAFVYSWMVVVLISAAIPHADLRGQQSEAPVTPPGALVDADWLADHLTRPDVRVIDLAHRVKNYRAGHIPGASFVDWRSDIVDPSQSASYAMPTRGQFEQLMGRLGIRPTDMLVLVDNMDRRSSIRMYLTCKYFGHDRVGVLDGGSDAWQSTGGLMTDDVPEFPATEYRVTQVRGQYLTTLQSVRQAMQDEQTLLLDGRPADQFTGESAGKVFHTGQEHQRRGHITSAVNIPWTDNFNANGTFKSLAELTALYAGQGIDDEHAVQTYCNEGLHASVPWFVLHELLGRDNVQVYDGSLAQWANRNDTPMNEGDN